MRTGLTRLIFLGACCALPACTATSSGPVSITKVNPYHLHTSAYVRTEDPMLRFENKRRLHGAVELKEHRELYGNYFTVFWKSESKSPVTVRFEYRQGNTGLSVHAQETVVDAPKRSNTTDFEVTGDDYHQNGKVTQWKATIVENGTVVAEYKSYLWQ